MEAFETDLCFCVWFRPSPHRRLLNALYAKTKDRSNVDVAPCDASKLTKFAVAAPRVLPAIGVDLERRSRRFVGSGYVGFLLITLQTLRALVASCSSSADASTLALFEEHVVAVIELTVSSPQLRVRAAALDLCAQFIEGQDFMVSQARLDGFLGPILQGCRVEAAPPSAAAPAADVDGVRVAAFAALKLLLVKSDVQGLEAFAPVVVPALLGLLLAGFEGGGAAAAATAALCDDCLSSITGALNAATAGFIYAPVLRFLDRRSWQPLPFAVHVLRLFDPVAAAAAAAAATAGASGIAVDAAAAAAAVAGVSAPRPLAFGGVGYGARRPAFTVPVVVTALRHLARADQALDAATAGLLRPRTHTLSMAGDDDLSAAVAAAAAAPSCSGPASSATGGGGLRLEWLYADAVDDTPPSPRASVFPGTVGGAASGPSAVARGDGPRASAFAAEFETLRAHLLRAVLATLEQAAAPGPEDLGSWAQLCLELLAPVVFESTEGNRPLGEHTGREAEEVAQGALASATAPELAARVLGRLARSLRAPQQLVHVLCDALDCFEEHATTRVLSRSQRAGGGAGRMSDGAAVGAPSASLLRRMSSRNSTAGAVAPSLMNAPATSDAGCGATAPSSPDHVPLGPSTLFLSVAVIAAARLRELWRPGSSGGGCGTLALASDGDLPASAPATPGGGAAGAVSLSMPREAAVALELALCDPSGRVRALGLATWHHLLCAGVEVGWPAACVEGPSAGRALSPMHPALRGLDPVGEGGLGSPGFGALAAVSSRTADVWLGLGPPPSVDVRVLLPSDALPRLISTLVRITAAAAAAVSGALLPPALSLSVRAVHDLLRAGHVEVLWRLLPAAFAVLTGGGAPGAASSTPQAAPALLSPLPPRRGSNLGVHHKPVAGSAGAGVVADVPATAGVAPPLSAAPPPPPAPVAAAASEAPGEAATATVGPTGGPGGDHWRRLAAAAWLASIASAAGCVPLRALAAEVLGPQPPGAPVVLSDGWIVPAGVSLEARGSSPLSASASPRSLPPAALDAAGVAVLQARAAEALLSGSPSVLEGLRVRFGIALSRQQRALVLQPAAQQVADSAAVSQSEASSSARLDAAASDRAGVNGSDGGEAGALAAIPAPAALPPTNAGLPRRLRRFRSDESMAGSGASAPPPPSLLSPSGWRPTGTSSAPLPADAGAAGESAFVASAATADPDSLADGLLEALLRLPFRVRPTLADALLAGGTASAGGTGDASAAPTTASAAATERRAARISRADGMLAAAGVSVAAGSGLPPLANRAADAGSSGGGGAGESIRSSSAASHSEGSQLSSDAAGAPGSSSAQSPRAAAVAATRPPAASIFTPAASSDPLPDDASLLALLDQAVSQGRRAPAAERSLAARGQRAGAAATATSGSSAESDLLGLLLAPLRGGGAEALVLRLASDPGSLALLEEEAFERAGAGVGLQRFSAEGAPPAVRAV